MCGALICFIETLGGCEAPLFMSTVG
jgi:hypothetical protein